MKNILRFTAPFLFVAVLFALYFTLGTEKPVKANESERITELKEELSERQAVWKEYAPQAAQGKIAERRMSLAAQEANTIREEIAILEGNEQGKE